MVTTSYCDCNNEYSTWQVMVEYLPKNILQQYRKLFSEYDPESTGVVRLADVVMIGRKLGKNFTSETVVRLLNEITGCDKCSDVKFVDFTEFLALISTTATNCVSEDQMLKIFKRFDQDGDGFIEKEELSNILAKVGEEVGAREIDEMMRLADKDGDGRVSYEEFVKMLTNSWNDEDEETRSKKNPKRQSIKRNHVVKKKLRRSSGNIQVNTNKTESWHTLVRENIVASKNVNEIKNVNENKSHTLMRDESMRRILIETSQQTVPVHHTHCPKQNDSKNRIRNKTSPFFTPKNAKKCNEPMKQFISNESNLLTVPSSPYNSNSSSSSSLSSLDSGIAMKNGKRFTTSSINGLKSAISRKCHLPVDFSNTY